MSEASTTRVERTEPGVALLRLHRPDQLNTADTSLAVALEVESRGQAFATRDPGFPAALAAVREQLGRG